MLSRRYYAQDASTSLLLAVDKSTILGRFIRLALDSYTYVRAYVYVVVVPTDDELRHKNGWRGHAEWRMFVCPGA